MNKDTFFKCSFAYNSEDQANVIEAYNQGIDSRLEGFTESKHWWDSENRLYLWVANAHEFQILVRRLLERATESAEDLADNMIMVKYGCEVI